MTRRSKSRLVLVLLILVIVGILANVDMRKRQAMAVVSAVEDYRQAHGELPKNLEIIGIHETESGPIYYRKESSQDYIIWYGTTLGSSRVYDSNTKRWSDRN